MKRKIQSIVFLMLINKLLLAQAIESKVNFQIDKIVTTATASTEYVASFYSKDEIYIICRTKDSLYVTSYLPTAGDKVYDVNTVLIGKDTLFLNTIDSLYHNAKEAYEYRLYSKNAVTSRNILLTFNKDNSIGVFYKDLATSKDLDKISRIINRLDLYMIRPLSGPSRGIKALKIENWDELLGYLMAFNYKRR